MIYTPMTIKAVKFACRAHEGQTDHSGIPYIFHPYHLAEQMDDEISCTVALLHDVVEDTEITLDDLRAEFPETVTDAVALLTYDGTSDYFDYVRRLKQNYFARRVKMADLIHNSDETRVEGMEIPEERLQYWRKKYAKAKAILLDQEEDG